jgi:hypothetical protein
MIIQSARRTGMSPTHGRCYKHFTVGDMIRHPQPALPAIKETNS